MSQLTPIGHWLRDSGLPAMLFILGAALIGRFGRWLSNSYRSAIDADVRRLIEQGGVASERNKRTRALAQAIEWTVVAVVYFVTGLLVLRQIGIPLTSLVAPATVAGVAIGFGAQQIVADLLAGFFLFAERQFGIGDLIRLSVPGQTTGISGTVEELTLRVTKLRSQEGEVIVIPNGALRQVTNLSKDWSRVVLDIPIPVTEDLETATAVLSEVAKKLAKDDHWKDLILGEPVVAGVESIEVGYVQLRLLVRTLPGRQFEVGRELRLRAATALREHGISSPPIGAPTDGSS